MTTTTADRAMICSADHRASSAGLAILRAGGSAVDAAVAAGAVLAVVAPQRGGMGGDLFAIVHAGPGPPEVMNASGRTGSGADPETLRREGHQRMPVRHDIRSVPVPGCVDGWLALHGRYGRLPRAEVLRSAVLHAEGGFATTPGLMAAVEAAAGAPGARRPAWADRPGKVVARPGAARALRAIVDEGRAGFYQGEFGSGLRALGRGHYGAADFAEPDAEWCRPLGLRTFGHDVWTAAPNSQGYVLLLALALAEGLGLPGSPDDPAWVHLLAESALAAAADRTAMLHEDADGEALVRPERIRSLRGTIDPVRHWRRRGTIMSADTTVVCAVDERGMGVSLLQSNANGLGSLLFEPRTGINLHSRGIAFGLAPGSPAEYGPRRRPPHTLVPVLVTRPDGALRAVLGSTGGDIQPQILMQLLVRALRHGAPPDVALAAPRWRLATGFGRFETWQGRTPIRLDLENGVPATWTRELPGYGHIVRAATADDEFGEAQLIEVTPDDAGLRGAAEPRAPHSAALGYWSPIGGT
ncbi:gamma-glutamyltransferase [Actinomadura macra]|uniref:gamma-glutamyltransferase n=1 Tax=Actinomadura macra TaxID=46164 RepID=UPI00082D9253|nr:gamma-glutamyltransferase [Actinomadura macra]